jgi:hypothetical protein
MLVLHVLGGMVKKILEVCMKLGWCFSLSQWCNLFSGHQATSDKNQTGWFGMQVE